MGDGFMCISTTEQVNKVTISATCLETLKKMEVEDPVVALGTLPFPHLQLKEGRLRDPSFKRTSQYSQQPQCTNWGRYVTLHQTSGPPGHKACKPSIDCLKLYNPHPKTQISCVFSLCSSPFWYCTCVQ